MNPSLVQEPQVDGDSVGRVVAEPVAMAGTANGDVPLSGGAQGLEGFDRRGHLLCVLGLEDTPRRLLPGGLAEVRADAAEVSVARLGGQQEAVAQAGSQKCIALFRESTVLAWRILVDGEFLGYIH